MPDEDDLADKYLLLDERLVAAGLHWYEVSNWARTPEAECRHNLGYWLDGDWWGVGPGAHSHLAGRRWWNVKHPARYAAAVAAGSPEADHEVLTAEDRHTERVMLRLRLATGLDLALLDGPARREAERAAADGLLDPAALDRGRAVLTRPGRLLADRVVQDLLLASESTPA
jgi:oxygen-independent coproporphyrinogen-3 oxidase